MKLGIFGYKGRMGQALLKEAIKDNINFLKIYCYAKEVCEKSNDNIICTDKLEFFCDSADIVIDFSEREASLNLATELSQRKNKRHIIGTTGFLNSDLAKIKELSNITPTMQSYNTSIGANLVALLAKSAASTLGKGIKITIQDIHHKYKKDAPSGTAIMIRDSIQEVFPGVSIDISSIREGDIVGDHIITFDMFGEKIELKHQAIDRVIFTKGALKAAIWLKDKPAGLYNMRDVIGL